MSAPPARLTRSYVVDQLARYWPSAGERIARLPVPDALNSRPECLPPPVSRVELPDWAADAGVERALCVPAPYIVDKEQPVWKRTDWFGVAFWFLNGCAEQAFERGSGPIHAYSHRLGGWDPYIWEKAWVNRIALFLRKWAARETGRDETELFGALPEPEILVTHDVDAIRKTPAIRLKQSAFQVFNSLRCATRMRLPRAARRLASAAQFLFSAADYWCFDELADAEEALGLRSCFFVYGGDLRQRSPQQRLLDPGYDLGEPALKNKLCELAARGWQVGLHQSFNAWRDTELMSCEKSRLERTLGTPVTMCRQHWLRFSWVDTWRAQQNAGLELDATLGFNDRPGFRNGAALRFHPWNLESRQPRRIAAVPMVLMDSHLYDYAELSGPERDAELDRWVDEVRAVRGTATINWHQHTLAEDYGWRPGFDRVLAITAASGRR